MATRRTRAKKVDPATHARRSSVTSTFIIGQRVDVYTETHPEWGPMTGGVVVEVDEVSGQAMVQEDRCQKGYSSRFWHRFSALRPESRSF